jgi:hypothetical protein
LVGFALILNVTQVMHAMIHAFVTFMGSAFERRLDYRACRARKTTPATYFHMDPATSTTFFKPRPCLLATKE